MFTINQRQKRGTGTIRGIGRPGSDPRPTGTVRGFGQPLTDAQPQDEKQKEEMKILDITRTSAFGWGQLPWVSLNDEVRSSLGSLGVIDSWQDERHPYAPDSTVSLLPLYVIFSGKIGTDFPYPSPKTRIARFHGMSFVFLKGRTRDGMILKWQKDHLQVQRDYPESMRIMTKDMLEKGIISTDVPDFGKSMMAEMDLSPTSMADIFLDRIASPSPPRRNKATMPLWCSDEKEDK